MSEVRDFIESLVAHHLSNLAKTCKSDVLAIYSPMHYQLPGLLRDEIENLRKQNSNKGELTILLDTGGGLIESVERTVDVIRHHYDSVSFVIPDKAMSAGTVFALSGDNIFMDYYSQLGPIDPQFYIDGKWVPGLGYLEKFEELNKKSEQGSLTALEYALVDKLDLSDLHRYEQAREHSVELLEKWLTKYKFKNWRKTQREGKKITMDMKKNRANDIARSLNDTTRWHTHSRGISMNILKDEIQLKIEDLADHEAFAERVYTFHKFMLDYMHFNDHQACLKSSSLPQNPEYQ